MKFLDEDLSLDTRQYLDIMFWCIVISLCAIFYYSLYECRIITIPVFILLIIFGTLLYINNKIAITVLKKRRKEKK